MEWFQKRKAGEVQVMLLDCWILAKESRKRAGIKKRGIEIRKQEEARGSQLSEQ